MRVGANLQYLVASGEFFPRERLRGGIGWKNHVLRHLRIGN
jgi:hypothetical protein